MPQKTPEQNKIKLDLALDVILFLGMAIMLVIVSFIVLQKVFKPISLLPLLPENTLVAEEWFKLNSQTLEPINDILSTKQKEHIISYIKATTLDATGTHELILLQLDAKYVKTVPQLMRKKLGDRIWYQKKLGRNTILLTTNEQVTHNTRSLAQNALFIETQQNSPRIYEGATLINWRLVKKQLDHFQISTPSQQLAKNLVGNFAFTQLSRTTTPRNLPSIISYSSVIPGKILQPAKSIYQPALLTKLPNTATFRMSGLDSYTKLSSLFSPANLTGNEWITTITKGLKLNPAELGAIQGFLNRETGLYQINTPEQQTTVFVVPYKTRAEAKLFLAISEKLHGYLNPTVQPFALRDGGQGEILVPQNSLKLLPITANYYQLNWTSQRDQELKTIHVYNHESSQQILLSTTEISATMFPTKADQTQLSLSTEQNQFMLHADQVSIIQKEKVLTDILQITELLDSQSTVVERLLESFDSEDLLVISNQFLDGIQVTIFPN